MKRLDVISLNWFDLRGTVEGWKRETLVINEVYSGNHILWDSKKKIYDRNIAIPVQNEAGKITEIRGRYNVGDLVIVNERFAYWINEFGKHTDVYMYAYWVDLSGRYVKNPDYDDICCYGSDYPGFHDFGYTDMSFKDARFLIKIVAIDCFMLNDISDEYCFKEGVKKCVSSTDQYYKDKYYHRDTNAYSSYYQENDWSPEELHPTPKEAYLSYLYVSEKIKNPENAVVWAYKYDFLYKDSIRPF